MTQINLRIRQPIYETCKIFIEKGISKKIGQHLKNLKLGKKYAIITDSKVKKLFGNTLQKNLKRNGIKSEIFEFPKGEKSKFLSTIENLSEKLVKNSFDKQDAIIALGGGVTGDIAGFLASVYMREISYIQVPTTLMAMVDSSIGGKTGVDLPSGKNLIGTITQPEAVFMDTNYLKSLPKKQIQNGLAEIIKYGVIKDKKLFKFIESNIKDILKGKPEILNYLIKRSAKIKTKIVARDEKDKGERMILNYGHTFGHAIERISGFKLLHGFAISIGMVRANKIAVAKGILKQKTADRIKNLIKESGLPVTTLKKVTLKDCLSDKKKAGKYIKLILPKKIGKVVIIKEKCQ
ncbi:3-dehydroquinate synthase [Candidatus Peregrinibacteria bacterium]|nr:3-dehydroquinate synthase [Candidatus Peregrinibacteria bacterium]